MVGGCPTRRAVREHATWTGTVYLAIVLDVFSRRIVGWRAAHTTTDLDSTPSRW